MKILITGKNSYIGNSVKNCLNEQHPSFIIDEISLRKINLNSISFKEYNVILHVAGIAHVSSNKKLVREYFRINRDLAIEVAKKAKLEGVKQFIFTSSMAIYGKDRPIGDLRPIDITKPSPTNAYGQSKLEADLSIQKLQDKNFHTSILRLPMIYGKSSKGNFLKLLNISRKIPLFPKISNIRSVLHIRNLSELVRLIIVNKLDGVFYPQDHKYFNTTEFILGIRSMISKTTILTPLLSFPIRIIALFLESVNKIYGNKFYQSSVSLIPTGNYQIYTIDDFIKEIIDVS
jgi:UDP-glucose 4-epimerase